MSGSTSADQAFIDMLAGIILINLENENFSVDELAHAARMPRSYIHKRLTTLTSKSISQFIRDVRLEKAMEMLQEEGVTAAEVAFKTGFGSSAYFNTCFHEYFGYPPGKVLKWSNNEGGINKNPNNDKICDNRILDKTKQIIGIQKRKLRKRRFWRILILVSVGIFIISWPLYLIRTATYPKYLNTFPITLLKGEAKSLVVLPFKNLSTSPEDQIFADGLLEIIISKLVLIREFRVVSRTSAEEFHARGATAPEIGKKLGVNFIIEGSVQHPNNRIIVIVQLIDAMNDQQIWSQKFDRELSDIIETQTSIAENLSKELQAILSVK